MVLEMHLPMAGRVVLSSFVWKKALMGMPEICDQSSKLVEPNLGVVVKKKMMVESVWLPLWQKRSCSHHHRR